MTGRPLRAIQQMMLGTVCTTHGKASRVLAKLVEAGFEGIELNGWMTRPTPALVRGLTRLGGMPAGPGGRLDWPTLIAESGLAVVGLHEDLATIESEPDAVAARAEGFGSPFVVVPGLYRFDYTSAETVTQLAGRLNRAGERLGGNGVRLLYHNHNAELRRTGDGRTAFEVLVERTDPDAVGFEFDAYWLTAAGADPLRWLRHLGERVAVLHLTDRGTRARGRSLTPIDRYDTVELGHGTMDLPPLVTQARAVGAHAVVLETHRNWIDRSPVASFTISAAWLRHHLFEETDA